MPFFIKTEIIREIYLKNKKNKIKETIQQHKFWVKSLKDRGLKIKSGFLVNEKREAGGGGFLIIECDSYQIAYDIVNQDPMIKNQLVEWKLHEWINVLTN
tara:strand:+ start:6418 stop:6717 length:300 start_codon:yes stop_codon:yes gene_type:complete